MVERQKSRNKLTAREKKILQRRLSELSVEKMADIWKINVNKKLDEHEMEQFEMLRKAYKEASGKELPKHKSKVST